MSGNTASTWSAPTASGPLDASVRVPGSKSITNRAFVLAALSDGPVLVRKPLDSRDARLMTGALSALGGSAEARGEDVLVRPLAPEGTEPVSVALGNAGTVARFTPALAGLGSRPVLFDGDEAIRRRPVAPLLRALAELGLDIEDEGRGAPPFTVLGHGGIAGGKVELDSSASSQFLSALLLAGPSFTSGVTVRLVGGAPPSEPHIAMTLDLLRRFGAAPERSGKEFHVPATRLSCPDYAVEPDLSTAAPFAAAAAVTGGSVRIEGWPERTTQPGDWLRSLLAELGQRAELDDTGLTVTGTGEISGARLDLHEVGELTPVVAALLCFADGPSVISGVAHLRGHETDRLAALATELSALGAGVTETEDGLAITPAPLRGGVFHTYEDHRLVMAAAVLGLRVPGVEVENPATVGKTFPGFTRAWQAMLG
ncbi:3-phosphoshikimate 1-carboxyvinyltransferase [Amycolatopsis acidiphila]|uniref:3-phosphoshikimate 1-carboxyvinyltransferase n=1 Tax=Amycolatopsis acidiphila TaxID=715473 RepID=A0A558A4V5_9PSEU|nr:3-phosphoshikimate 1-carboxyvinyltransferase [Amycolatopsis acidiphila]TVT19280.1 3-phosphoshikimate 1-carboxyvinyltransferase [Amycolatopsis acidiphila]UIJ62292.1 3-phosphoshikimate 1-carboxyvinyltransferase [Amycolatopsis acidiphila]GHG96682.1 3-phosphoshikimate 1-carboxyvinyltransferase 1 [Amycolatopsis acidiphila]